ncbi:MAG TPA: DUF6798 domain-containing protein [Bryobacteraceae bacterium]|nr:DUF6798 domain-containing protein [Bryobacteraceae bacterium]
MNSWASAAAVTALALLTFVQFPGHTYLQQDSQIYIPILEHLRDPLVLRNDILVAQPHVTFTLYDETARLLRAVTSLGFREVLAAGQVATRALGIWGLYLMATSIGLGTWQSLLVAAVVSLGAAIPGPEVLTFEYEPTPRAFAVPLLVCGVGLAAHRRYLAAGVAGAAAFLYHAPTTIPFWAVFLLLLIWRKKLAALAPLACAAVVLAEAVAAQAGGAGSAEAQTFFSRLSPLQEQLQHMRTAYVWISSWPPGLIPHYLIVSAILLAAFLRVRRDLPQDLQILLLGLPAVGLASMPISWMLLEHFRWSLVPQVQPMRALLFVVLCMQFLAAVAATYALKQRRIVEGFVWFTAGFLPPLHILFTASIAWRTAVLALVLGALMTLAARMDGRLALAVAIAAFFAIPSVGGVVNYPRLHTPELAQLSEWARNSTSPDAVFLFPDAGHGLSPGIFRSEALRAVYVDWKGGGQVNYLRDFGEQWWFRWQLTMANGFRPDDLLKYAGLGVRYIVLKPPHRLPRTPLFENPQYLVYEAR